MRDQFSRLTDLHVNFQICFPLDRKCVQFVVIREYGFKERLLLPDIKPGM